MKKSPNNLNVQDTKELLQKIISIWKSEGKLDADEMSNFYQIEKDPAVKLLIAALAYQARILEDNIFDLKENIIEALMDEVLPYHLVRPIPAYSMMETALSNNAEEECFADESTLFIIEKEKERKKGKNKEKEKFLFVPLLRTRIINARIEGVNKVSESQWEMIMRYNNADRDLSGLSFYFLNNDFLDVNISCNNYSLSLIRPMDFDNMPFISWFNINNMFFDKSIKYGTTESWAEIFVKSNLKLYYIDHNNLPCSPDNNNLLRFTFEFTGISPSFHLNKDDIKINSFPVVNVQKAAISLSKEEPIQKIAEQKQPEGESQQDRDDGNNSNATSHKMFLNLLAPSTLNADESRDLFTVRRFGVERYNRNELLYQINSLIDRYVSDYYAFKDIPGLKDGHKMRQLNLALKEVISEVNKDEYTLDRGIYIILNQQNPFMEQSSTIEVNYLLTDGNRANGISADSSINPQRAIFDKKETHLLMETMGGKDENMNRETKHIFTQYYCLTKERLVTKADIRFFCYKELSQRGIRKEQIRSIKINNIDKQLSKGFARYISIEICLNNEFDNFFLNILAGELQNKIRIYSASVYPIEIKLENEIL